MKKITIILMAVFMIASTGVMNNLSAKRYKKYSKRSSRTKRSQRWFVYDGNIGPYPILFFVNPYRNTIKGKYLYKKYGKIMMLKGTQTRKGKFRINEINPITGKVDATFSGKLKSPKKVTGWWKHTDGRRYKFNLNIITRKMPNLGKARDKFLSGEKFFSMQWISWDNYGMANFIPVGKGLYLYGNQTDPRNGNYVRMQGVIQELTKNLFVFDGVIDTFVDYNGKRTCTRKGKMIFRKRAWKQYYRLQEMESPCSNVTDYIDIFTH